MLDILQQYLIDCAAPEMKDVLVHAIEGLDDMGLTDIYPEYEMILMLDDTVEPGETLDAIIHLTSLYQKRLLAQHTISLSEEAPMSAATDILNAILRIPDFEDKHALINIVSSEKMATESFADILALVTGQPPEKYLVHLHNVGAVLLRRIREKAEEEVKNTSTVEENTDHAEYIHRFKFYLNTIAEQPLLITDMLKANMSVGYPYTQYADLIGRDFEGMYPERAAMEMVGMAIVSSDGKHNIRNTIVSNLEHYITSVQVMTKILMAVDKLIAGLPK